MATVPVIKITAVDNASRAIRGVTQNFDKMTNRLGRSEGFLTRNRRAFQQLGFQVGDFATQVGGGQSALLAFTQQGSQMLQFFGPLGAVLAGLVAVLGSMALAITRSGAEMSDLVPLMGVLEPLAGSIATAFGSLKDSIVAIGKAIPENLDRIFIIATTVATFFAIKWVVAFFAARNAVFLLGAALFKLEVIMMRFLPLAVLIAVGELLFRFIQLTKAVGGIGEAISLVGRVFGEAVGNWKKWGMSLLFAMEGIADSMVSAFVGAFRWILEQWDNLVNSIVTSPLNAFLDKIGIDFKFSEKNAITEMFKDAEQAWAKSSMTAFQTAAAFRDLGMEASPELQNMLEIFKGLNEETNRLSLGVTEAGDSAKEAASNLFDFVGSVKSTLRSSIDSVFDALIDKSKSVGDAIRNLGLELAKLAAKQAVFKFLAAAMPGTFGSGGFLPLLKNANGNAFNNGRVTAFASGGVVSSPTTFPMRGGSGLMGEAGPEAIMPLTRVGGKLGVRSAGGGGAKTSIQIINNTPAQVRHETSQGDDGEAIQRFIIDTVGRGTARGEMDGSMGARFGQRPKRITR